jgi:hypothetical protein
MSEEPCSTWPREQLIKYLDSCVMLRVTYGRMFHERIVELDTETLRKMAVGAWEQWQSIEEAAAERRKKREANGGKR